MTSRFMVSVAAVALIAGAGFANAQGTGSDRDRSPAGSAQQSAPERGNSAAPANRGGAESTSPSSGMKATQSEEKSPGAGKNQRADDKDMQKSKSMSSDNERAKGGKDMKAEGREGGKDMKAEGKEGGKDMKAQSREDQKTTQSREGQKMDQKGAADSKSQTGQTGQTQTGQTGQTGQSQTGQTGQTGQTQTGQTGQTQTGQTGQTQPGQTGQSMQSQTTTGQAGAAARLSTEQRTQITSVIREQRVQPISNVNFSLSVGTRVPRDVSFHTLPDRVVTIYPEWRGFRFIRVKEQIVIVDPNTYEIVAILDV
jgi:hypothetical protein